MIRGCENILAPINKIPPEILALIPDFWDTRHRDEGVITLTHVCHAWREIFVSRSSLWTNFDCLDEEKTRVYFERSKSSPIDLSLGPSKGILPCDPIFQIIPHATGRLKSLFVRGPTEDVEVVTSHLSHPAPLLERLSIHSDLQNAQDRNPALPSTFFNEDLSSLRMLYLNFVHTELPWRNMVNLASLTLSNIPPGAVSTGQLLDFLESAPYLEEVKFCYATPTTGIQGGRLVSLACLKSMEIYSDGPISILLDHLLIPVGAKLETYANLPVSPIGEHLPRSLDNLKNLSDFTVIELHPEEYYQDMKFSGPNGQVNITIRTSRDDPTGSMLDSLAKLDTSKTERLEMNTGNLLSREPFYQALLPMKDLRILALTGCTNPDIFIYALQPPTSSSEAMVCPKLEEIILTLQFEGMFDITSMIEMAAARASGGKKLRTIRIVDGREGFGLNVSELRRHVWNVEYGPEV